MGVLRSIRENGFRRMINISSLSRKEFRVMKKVSDVTRSTVFQIYYFCVRIVLNHRKFSFITF